MKKLFVDKKSNFSEEKKSNIEKVNSLDISKNEEPSWYHYVIVILVLVSIIFLIYYASSYFNSNNKQLNITNINNVTQTYNYKEVVGNITYNIQFHSPIVDIENSNLSIQVSKYEILNSHNILFSFMQYNITENKYISISSVKLMKFFKYFYKYDFAPEDFVMFNETNCSSSNLANKVVIFNPYSNKEGVFYDKKSGCVNIESFTPERIVFVNDVFMFRLINNN